MFSRKAKKDKDSVLKSVFLAYFILLLHAGLVCGLFGVVIFMRGVVQYMPFIFLGGTAVIVFSGYRFYLRMKREHKTLAAILRDPLFEGRSVEVRVLGGLAEFRLGQPREPMLLDAAPGPPPALEGPERLEELSRLALLYEKELITLEEFEKAKKGIFRA